MYGFVFDIGNDQLSTRCMVNDTTIIISCEREEYERLVSWLFKNTKKRFVFLGVNHLYFEDKADALAFKMTYDVMNTIKLKQEIKDND